MGIVSYASIGYEGEIVTVEVDIRRGIPGIDIVGLPDGAVREARDRIRVAVTRSGWIFPRDRILVSLAPAGIRKEGAVFDLAIALAILNAAGNMEQPDGDVLVIGELELSGRVRAVRGVLPAVAAALRAGVNRFIVPEQNTWEASALGKGSVVGVGTLREAVGWAVRGGSPPPSRVQPAGSGCCGAEDGFGDFTEIRGHRFLKRALEIAAAGRHHVLLFGPPGGGKTMSALRYPGILPDLPGYEAVECTKIHSLAGTLAVTVGLMVRPPFRTPHHSASLEGLIGGGSSILPGEISLAHRGVLFLDEAPEFGKHLLQALREPIETGRVDLSRAGSKGWFPADFQLILAANACPCGNLGRDDGACTCTRNEMFGYWRRLGGPLLDRIDIRVPVKPMGPETMLGDTGESSGEIRARVEKAIAVQTRRYAGLRYRFNGRLEPSAVHRFCPLENGATAVFTDAARTLALSSRACHSVLKVARTIADLGSAEEIGEEAVLEAFQMRRFGDTDPFWEIR